MSPFEIIDAEFEEVRPARAEPRPERSDYILAVVFLGVVVAAGSAAALGAGALMERIDWTPVGLVVCGVAVLALAVAWWRLTLALIALAAALAILAHFGLLVSFLAVLAVLALLGVVVWGVLSTVGRG